MSDWGEIWPLHHLQLKTPRLVLRPVRDEDLPGLVRASLAGIHDPDSMPFQVPWTREDPATLAFNTAQSVWRQRTNVTPSDWTVSFAVLKAGAVIGRQDVGAVHFPDLKTVATGSWLTRAEQGAGLGKEMRAAVLLWAFDHLGAEYAETAAFEGNEASQGVSRSLGYRSNGERLKRIGPGEVARSFEYRLRRDQLVRPEWELAVEGHGGVARLFGLT